LAEVPKSSPEKHRKRRSKKSDEKVTEPVTPDDWRWFKSLKKGQSVDTPKFVARDEEFDSASSDKKKPRRQKRTKKSQKVEKPSKHLVARKTSPVSKGHTSPPGPINPDEKPVGAFYLMEEGELKRYPPPKHRKSRSPAKPVEPTEKVWERPPVPVSVSDMDDDFVVDELIDADSE
jgi:hypothetical protein